MANKKSKRSSRRSSSNNLNKSQSSSSLNNSTHSKNINNATTAAAAAASAASSKTSLTSSYVPLGIDIGSFRSRLSFATSSENNNGENLQVENSSKTASDTTTSKTKTTSSSTNITTSYKTPSNGTPVVFSSGLRYVTSLVAIEELEEDLREEWEGGMFNPNSSPSSKGGGRNKKVEIVKEKELSFAFGDDASKVLLRSGKAIKDGNVVFLCSGSESSKEEEIETTDNENLSEEEKEDLELDEQDRKNAKLASNAFFQHLFTETAAVSSSHPSLIRAVLCIPDEDCLVALSEDDSPLSEDDFSLSEEEKVKTSKEQSFLYNRCNNGLTSTIAKIGWDNSPQMLSCPIAVTNKKERNKWRAKVMDEVRIIGCISNSAAICNAYGLLDDDPSSSKENTYPTTTISATVPLLIKPCNTTLKHVIIIDWGNNSLNFNYLQRIHNQHDDTMEAFYTHSLNDQNQLKTMTNYGGEKLRKLLTNYVCEQFERKNRRNLEPGSKVCNSKKSYQKILNAIDEVVLGALSSWTSNTGNYSGRTIPIRIDGLMEGLDCSVDMTGGMIMSLLNSYMNGVATAVKDYVLQILQQQTTMMIDGVLLAGGTCDLPFARMVVEKALISTGKVRWIGAGRSGGGDDGGGGGMMAGMASEGCARHAALLASSFAENLFGNSTPVAAESSPSSKEEMSATDSTSTNNGEKDGISNEDVVITPKNNKKENNDEDKKEDEDESIFHHVKTYENVLPCPVGVGLVLNKGDSASVILVNEGSLLPAFVSKKVEIHTLGNSDTNNEEEEEEECFPMWIVQTNNTTTEKVLGTVQVPINQMTKKEKTKKKEDGEEKKDDGKEFYYTVDVITEIDTDGRLRMSIGGGPVVTF